MIPGTYDVGFHHGQYEIDDQKPMLKIGAMPFSKSHSILLVGVNTKMRLKILLDMLNV